MNGDHGQIVQQHVVKEFKQGQELVLMMLQTLASHSLSKKVALFSQLIGGHGQIVRRHAIVVSRQEQEHVLTILQTTAMSQQLAKKLATFGFVKNQKITICQGVILMPRNPGEIYFTRFTKQKTGVPQKLSVNLMVRF